MGATTEARASQPRPLWGRTRAARWLAGPALGVLGVLGALGALVTACSSPAPSSAAPVCDVDAGVAPRGGFCVVDEVPPAQGTSVGPDMVSLSRDIQPILNHYCAVVGCHVSGSPTGGLNLAPGFAYAQLVNVKATELAKLPSDNGEVLRVAPNGDLDHSYLHIKIHPTLFADVKSAVPAALQGRMGTEMPAKATGSVLEEDTQVALIDQWIAAGAADN